MKQDEQKHNSAEATPAMPNTKEINIVKVLVPGLAVSVIAFIYGAMWFTSVECRGPFGGCEKFNFQALYTGQSQPFVAQVAPETTSLQPVRPITPLDEGTTIAKRDELQLRALKIKEALSAEGLAPADKTRLDETYKRINEFKGEIEAVLKVLEGRRTKLALDSTSQKVVKLTQSNKRLLWSFFTGLIVALGFLALGFTCQSLREIFSARGTSTNPMWWPLIGGFLFLIPRYGLDVTMTPTAFEQVLGVLPLTANPKYFDLLILVDSLVGAFVVAFAVAVCALLWKLPEVSAERENRRKTLNFILYGGTLLLVTGVLRFHGLMDWVASYCPAELQSAAAEMSKTLVAAQGVFYSLILAAVYLTARYFLGPGETTGEDTSWGWFKTYLPKATAMLAPLFAGPVAELVKGLFS